MKPGKDYTFPGDVVLEVPMKNKVYITKYLKIAGGR